MPIIRLLHLSDLRGYAAASPPAALRDGPWGRLLDELAEVGLVDMICLTGDLASSGRREEFSALTSFLERSRTRLGVAADRFFAVPGDGDVDRAITPEPASRLRELARRQPAAVSAWIAGQRTAPAGADAACLRAVFLRQQAFWEWLVGDLRQPERREVDALGYHARVPIPGGNGQVQVFGLNSAWLSAGRSLPDETLLLGREQVAALVHDATGAPHPGLRLALVHHPPAALADGSVCAALLADTVDLVLCGHGPHPRFTALANGARQLAGGPLGDDAGARPSCQMIQVETNSAGRPLGFAARVWTWCPADDRWQSDAPSLPAARRGRLHWPGTASMPRGLAGRTGTLAGLLARLFASADELRRWLCVRLPDIYADLPGGTASLSDLAFASQGLLERAGLIDHDLLDALADFSPAYGPAVVELGERLRTAAATQPSAPPPLHSASPPLHSAPPPPDSTSPPLHSTSPPTPADQAMQRQLADAQRRRGNLQAGGLDATGIDEEILELRRRLREAPAARNGAALGDGRYLLHGVLGRGGFATVWRARDHAANREVALKILHPQDAQDPARRERFFRGARAMQQLQHPAVVRVLDPHGGDLPQPFFVMEVIDGRNLHEAVIAGPRLELPEVVAITCTIGEALSEAHARGMVHRDIKPANIILDRAGGPHLTDFDLVRARDTTGGTRTGGMGTVIYAAPELIQNAEHADARADIYGLGMTVLFMLFGKDLPYKDVVRNPDVVLAHVACPIVIKRVVLKAISWDHQQRFADVADFCAALRRALEQSTPRRPTAASIVAPQPRAARPASTTQSRELWALGLSAAALILALLVLGPLLAPDPSPASAAAPNAAAPNAALAAGPTPVQPTPRPTTQDPVRTPVDDPDDGAAPTSTGAPFEAAEQPLDPPPADRPVKLRVAARPTSEPSRDPTTDAATSTTPEPAATPTTPGSAAMEPTPSAPPPRSRAEELAAALRSEAQAIGEASRERCRTPSSEDETLVLRVVIDASGAVVDASAGASARGTDLGNCMEREMTGARLTPFTGPRQIFDLSLEF